MCKTKIVATLGPASHTRETLTELIKAGVNVVRLNFSHGNATEHIARAEMVREIAKSLHVSVGVLVDLQGPKIRIACFEHGEIHLTAGDTFILDGKLDNQSGTQERVGLDYPELIDDLDVGNILLLDDGRIQLTVTAVDTQTRIVHTIVLNSGKLSNRKGINLLGGGLSAPALTEKDKLDILTAAALKADFLAISFPRNAHDIELARELAKKAGCQAHIVAKIERAEVVANEEAMDSVIRASDVIMVARGDLGVEIGDARLPSVQKALISRAKHFGIPVITATQMMESMIDNPLPTRAEVLDVANAVIDGTDAIMLSAESAAGRYPVEAVKAMVRIAKGVEHDDHYTKDCWGSLQHLCHNAGRSFALSSMISVSKINKDLGVAIITERGDTPLLMSRCQSQATIWAISDKPDLLGKLSILRGVIPTYCQYLNKQESIVNQLIPLVRDSARTKQISTILVTQLESVEGVGNIDVCRLVNLEQPEELAA